MSVAARRTLRLRASAASGFGRTAAAGGSSDSSPLPGLLRQWRKAIAAWEIELRIDEKSAAEVHRDTWSALEDQIFATQANPFDDLWLKLAFYREVKCLVRVRTLDDPRLEPIFADIECMFPAGASA